MRTNLELAIKERLREINFETEEGLILMMTTEVAKDAHERKVSTSRVSTNRLVSVQKIKTDNKVVNTENKIKDTLKYFYVYTSHSILDWEFSRCATIEEAIKKAILYLDAYIIYDGNIIKYDAIDDSTAYYYKNNKKYIVNIA